MSDSDILKEIDFKEMQEVGLSMIMFGTMYTYLTHMMLNKKVVASTHVFDCLVKTINEMMLEFDQDFYLEELEDGHRVYNIGSKIVSLIKDYHEWRDVFKEMGFMWEDNEN